MKYAIHSAILSIWFVATRYSIVCLERDGYDIGLIAILFLCGVICCSQLFLLFCDFEEAVCK